MTRCMLVPPHSSRHNNDPQTRSMTTQLPEACCGRSSKKTMLLTIPNNVHLNSESERLKTFSKWDVDSVSPNDMAEIGFYHVGHNVVMCTFCGIVLVNWHSFDDPFDRHRRMSPDCPFISGEDCDNVPIEHGLLEWSGRYAPSPPKMVFDSETKIPHIPFDDRKLTFRNSWSMGQLLANKIITAGFIYSGVGDTVVCCACRLNVSQWSRKSDPWLVHVIFSPECPFVQRNGTRSTFVTLTKRSDANKFECRACHRVKTSLVLTLNCGHCVMCVDCAQTRFRCVLCNRVILRRVKIICSADVTPSSDETCLPANHVSQTLTETLV